MPREPEPVRIETPRDRRNDANVEYTVRIHTAHEPSGRRRTVNRQAIVEATSPERAGAVAIGHLMQSENSNTKESGTRYNIVVTDAATKNRWKGTLEYTSAGEEPAQAGKRTAEGQSTYRQRAQHYSKPHRDETADTASRRKTRAEVIDPKSDRKNPDDQTKPVYYVKLLSQQPEQGEPMPLDADATVRGGDALEAAEAAVRSFRTEMPGLVSRQGRQTTYQVDVVRQAEDNQPYEGWHIEVVYDTKSGVIGGHGHRNSDTVH